MPDSNAPPPPRKRKPNIVLFISDQQRADAFPGGAATGRITPHLDWLADRSHVFSNAFCATPVCGPSRATLLTGLYPHTHGLVANHQARPVAREIGLPRNIPVLADFLAPHGYACAISGKWHLGTGSDRRGFTSFITRHGDPDVSTPQDNEMLAFASRIGVTLGGKHMGIDPDPAAFDARTRIGPSKLPLAFHPSHRYAAAAADFIRRRAGEENPFLLVYSCHEPHTPFVSPRPFNTLVSPSAVALPASWKQPIDPQIQARRHSSWHLKPVEGNATEPELRAIWAAYLSAVAYVDHLVGIVLEALITSGQLEDTIFIFTSDHGDMLGAHNVLLKGAVLFDEIVRVPLLLRIPGQEQGRGCKQQTLASLADVVPTLLSLCGVVPSSPLQGRDLSPHLIDGTHTTEAGIPLEYHSGNWGEGPAPLRGWRTHDWKYVEELSGPAELYDLRSNPEETINLVHDPAATRTRERLRSDLHAWLRRTGDTWPRVAEPPASAATGGG